MARHTFHQRAERALRLLLGMRSPGIAEQLADFGFSQDVLEQGWDLMRALTSPGEAVQATVSPRTEQEIAIEEWVQQWVPIARRIIHTSHPKLEGWLFEGLHSARGKSTVPMAATFLERLRQLEAGTEPLWEGGPAALATLARHGLTPEKRQEIQTLVGQAWKPQPAWKVIRSLEQDQAASDALWDWYLTWSEIARAAIKNKVQLRALGFAPRAANPGEDERAALRSVSIRLDLVEEMGNRPQVPGQRRLALTEPQSSGDGSHLMEPPLGAGSSSTPGKEGESPLPFRK